MSEIKNKTSFDWMAVIIYPLAVVLMEAFWVYPWLSWIGNWPAFSDPRPVLSLVSIIVVLAIALLMTRRVLRQNWPMWLTRTAVIGGGLVVIFLTIRIDYSSGYGILDTGWYGYIGRVLSDIFQSSTPVVLSFPVLLYLWWRGMRLGQTTPYFKDIYRSFIIGLAALIVLIIIWQISTGSEQFPDLGPGVGWAVIGFFFFGLIAIAISHLYQMRGAMPKEEAAMVSVKRWLPIMLGVIGGMVAVVFGVASLFSDRFFKSVGQGAGVVFGALGKVFHYILIPLNYIFEGIFWLLNWIVSHLRGPQINPGEETGNGGEQTFPDVVPRELSPEVMLIIKWVIIAIIIAAVIYILAKAISRFTHRREKEEIEEIHESLWSWKGLRDDLRQLLGMMGQRFARKRAPPAHRVLYKDDDARLDVREIYRHLQWEAARSGVPRRKYETAVEYSRRLAGRVPESGEPLSGLTELYGDVRYGEKPPPEVKVDNANGLWRAVRGLLRQFRGDR